MSKLQEKRWRETGKLIERLEEQREAALDKLLRIHKRLVAAHKLAARQGARVAAGGKAKGQHNIHSPLGMDERFPVKL